jgi:hypothetical protein
MMAERSNWGGTLSDGHCPRCDRLTAERDAAEARAVKAERIAVALWDERPDKSTRCHIDIARRKLVEQWRRETK